MKRPVFAGLLLLAAASAFPASIPRLSFHISGGINYAAGGDLSRGLNGYNSFIQNQYTVTGGFNVPGLSPQFGGEILYRFNDHLSAGLGFGYFAHKKESRAAYVFSKTVEVTETVSPEYAVVPLTLNVHYSIPWMGPYRLDFFLGGGLYRTRLKYAYSQTASVSGFSGTDTYTFDAKKNGYGVEAGAAFEWVVSPRFSVRFNLTGRLVSLTDITGGWTEKGEGDFWVMEESGSAARIWYATVTTGDSTYDVLVFQEDMPDGTYYQNVRSARLSLSGITLTLGFKIGLF
jgi:hypothetical protein